MRDASARGPRARAAKRTLVVEPVRSGAATINITPLIDVVLVLLIIFMVMTPLVERDLTVSLAGQQHTQNASDVAPEQVLVSVEESGTLQINAQPVAKAEYEGVLRGLMSKRQPRDRVVFVMANDGASVATLVAAIDAAKSAGATTVGLAADAVR